MSSTKAAPPHGHYADPSSYAPIPEPTHSLGPEEPFGTSEPRANTEQLLNDESGSDTVIPVYGPLAAAATTYQYTQQHGARKLHVEYATRSRLAEMCGKPTHRGMVMIWDELFWILSMPLLLISTFFNAAIKFVLESVVRPLLLGPIQLLGDHLFKPLSVVQFDALVLPGVTLLANSFGALLLMARPLSQLLDLLFRPLATLLSSFRLVSISYGPQPPPLATAHAAQQV